MIHKTPTLEEKIAVINAVQSYFDAWNSHDSKELMQSFTKEGSYADPSTQGSIDGEHIGLYLEKLVHAIPDLKFQIKSLALTDNKTIEAQWVMTGTNARSIANGVPPTGKSIQIPGSGHMTINGAKVEKVRGYFDQGTFFEQLGLK